MAVVRRSGYRAFMKLKGTIRRSDLEGGLWLLETEGGDRYQLVGKVEAARDGMRAEVEGKVDKNAMGFGMAGPLHQITVPPTWPGHREVLEGLPIHLRALQADPNSGAWRIWLVILRDDRIAIGAVTLKGPPRNGEVEL